MFIYQVTVDALELKRDKGIDYVFLVGNQREHITPKLTYYILRSHMA